MSIIQKTIDKLTTGNKMQYILVGTLILVIILSLFSLFWARSGKGQNQFGSGELRYWCEECEKKFTLKPKGGRRRPPDMMMSVTCPSCKKRTGQLMMQCPNPECKEWFVRVITPEGMFCPNCDTNVFEWQNEPRKKRKKK